MDTAKKFNAKLKCVHCGKDFITKMEVEPAALAPNLRGDMRPAGINYEYNVSSDDIKAFIVKTAKQYVPDAHIEIVTRFCEKKKRKDNEPHRSYAAFKIGFSHHVLPNDGEDDSWFRQLGESGSNVMVVKDLWDHLINRWRYDPKFVDDWLKSYKRLEQLEDGLGITEAFINEIKEFNRPRGIKVPGTNDVWVTFMASPEKILNDFFSDPVTGKLAGRISVADIVQVSKPPKEVVNYKIFMNPYQVETTENPHVRQILSGNEKG